MATLLLRLAAPLQAWGADSKFETRRTGREPTKSGVLGLLAAALGIRRDEPEKLQRLNALRFGVRVDQEGQLLVDFHTAWKEGDKNPYITYRHYLSDAIFLVGLESDDGALLQSLQAALQNPVFPPFLGRRACPPTPPFCLGVRNCDLLTALQSEASLVPAWRKRGNAPLRMVLDADPQEKGAAFQRDLPLSFSPLHRQHGYRAAKEINCALRSEAASAEPDETKHDPFVELR